MEVQTKILDPKPLAEGEIFIDGQWIPTQPPEALLLPWEEPDIDPEIVLGPRNAYTEQYYLLSGRYLGNFETPEAADNADPYRYTRLFLPDSKLPWEEVS